MCIDCVHQLCRECEHDLKVSYLRQQPLADSLDPLGPACAPTLRTVAIATGVVDREFIAATQAAKQVPVQRCGPAEPDPFQGTGSLERNALREVIEERLGKLFQYRGDRQLFSLESSCEGRSVGSIQRGHWRVGSQSSGLGADCRCCFRQCR